MGGDAARGEAETSSFLFFFLLGVLGGAEDGAAFALALASALALDLAALASFSALSAAPCKKREAGTPLPLRADNIGPVEKNKEREPEVAGGHATEGGRSADGEPGRTSREGRAPGRYKDESQCVERAGKAVRAPDCKCGAPGMFRGLRHLRPANEAPRNHIHSRSPRLAHCSIRLDAGR